MKSTEDMSRGLAYVTDPDTGRSYPIPSGSSDGGVSVSDDGGTAQDGGEGSGQQSSGQGFLEPYLADVPEDQRSIVEPVLEKFRKDQDAKVNKRFEELKEETKIATNIHQALLQDPVNTLNWIADRFEQEQGIDVRADLMQRWNDYVQSGQGEEPPNQSGQGEEDKPLTQAELNRLLEERDQQREQEIQRQQREQQAAEQSQKTINSWIDEAAKSTGLSLDDSNGEDPLRPVIIMQANQLYEQGVAKGQAAIEMATESVAKRFGTVKKGNGAQEQPRVATGGTPPGQEKIDVSDPKQRRARMLEHLTAQNQS